MNDRNHHQRTPLLIATVFLSLLLASITPVAATNFGSSGTAGTSGTTNGVWLTNNSFFNVYQRGLTTKYAAGVNDTIVNDYDLVNGWSAATWAATSCDDSGADVCVYDSNYGDNGLNGWNACAGTTSGSHPNQQCSVTWVTINEYYSPPATRIACHEIAHSTGLRHTSESTSCVKRTADGGTSARLSSHDKAHLDAQY